MGGDDITMNDLVNIKDYQLGLDDLGQPNVIDMSMIRPGKMNSAVLFIARLLYLKKGTYADQPEMGIDIIRRYRFSFEEELVTLSNELEDQITQYMPEFVPVTVKCNFTQEDNRNNVVISVSSNGITYRMVYDTIDNTLDAIKGT